ncbi:GntR family transcriptional regulator [Brevundimonas goettingensis]|uniref:HTH gntR-type domain-containing protein n=1 Tax=Brevundimonas goettingensis TaxID=2774190 RepID=A0A975BYX2_9CAUL|nr:hypothetical protein [Brevundimonas goettingensis]QTC90313.1 hypothetical protein IFJ75_13645 [Brevundimonas goettingensis]
MARNRDPFSLALQTLRQQAVDGVFAPDRAIVILDAAHGLRLSTTPVREALAWLGGEGMVERSPNGGYTGLRQDAASVRGRYRLRLALLKAALAENEQALKGWVPPSGASLADLLSTIVRLGGDEVLWRAYDRVARQLVWLEAAEVEAIPELDGELDILRQRLEGEPSEFLAALDRLHRKLAGRAAAILLAAQRPNARINPGGVS